MTHVVEVRYTSGDMAVLMADIRTWLDHKQIESEEFRSSSGCPGLAFRVGFRRQDHAAEFAKAFGGWLHSAEPHRANLWTSPHPPAAI